MLAHRSIFAFGRGVRALSTAIQGRTAVVTGSTSGIGLGVLEAFAQEGCNVVMNGFGDEQEIRNHVTRIKDTYGVGAIYNAADMTQPAQIRGMVQEAESTFGACDILVNNAGIQHVSPVDEFPEDKWEAILSINLSAAFHSSKAALPGMKARQYGRIINVASVHGLVGSTGKSAYVAAKHGIVGLTKVTALDNAGTGVTCNAICPGWTLTPLVQKQIDARAEAGGMSVEEATTQLLAEKQPSKEFTTPEQLGGIAVFLSSPYANQMTGTTLSSDGGWTAQ